MIKVQERTSAQKNNMQINSDIGESHVISLIAIGKVTR